MNDADHVDREVQGLSRFLPTTLSKSLLAAVVPVPVGVFHTIRSNAEWFLLNQKTPLEKTLVAALAAAAFGCVILLVLIIELALVLNAAKHRRIVHYSNQHPYLSPRYLWENSSVIVKVFTVLVVTSIYYVGYATAAY